MAQSTTDLYSVPVAHNRSFSIFKSESTGADSMNPTAAKTSKPTGAVAKSQRQAQLSIVRPTEQPKEPAVNTQPTAAPVAEQMSLADLRAQQRALNEQIKAARSAQPKVEKQPKPTKTLQDVVAQQVARPRTDAPRIICTYLLQREAAGQDRTEALDQVLGQMRSIVLGALDARQPGESYHAAIFRYLGRTDMLDTPASDDSSDDTNAEQ